MITSIYPKLQIKLKDNMFVHYNGKIVDASLIRIVTCDDFVKHNTVHVHYYINDTGEAVTGVEALNLIMKLCPAILEGMQAKHVKHSWAIHNLIGHPLMQILTWLNLTKLALWFHDATIPKPLLNDEGNLVSANLK